MAEGSYYIQPDESKLKHALFQNKFQNSIKKRYQVIDPRTNEKKEVEFEEAASIVLEELRKGAHGPEVEDYIRTALTTAQQHRSNNIKRQKYIAQEKQKFLEKPLAEREKVLEGDPNYMKRFIDVDIHDSAVDLCLSTAYMLSNLSVSSSSNGNKPLVHRYLEPYTKEEIINRQAPLPEEKKKGFGGIF